MNKKHIKQKQIKKQKSTKKIKSKKLIFTRLVISSQFHTFCVRERRGPLRQLGGIQELEFFALLIYCSLISKQTIYCFVAHNNSRHD